MTARDDSFSPLTHTNIYPAHEYGVKFGVVSSDTTKAVDENQIAPTKDKLALKTNTEKDKKCIREMKGDSSSTVYLRKCFYFAFRLI